jgi:phospholipase/carboxylesterase
VSFTQMPIALDGGRQLAASLFQPDTDQDIGPDTGKNIKPKKLVVLMHGWGADSQDLLPLAPMLAGEASGLAIIVPDAPDICSANPFGRQWFELASPDLSSELIAGACLNAAPVITQMLEALCDSYQISGTDIVLGGFSQGGMIALSAGLSYKHALGGIFCLSGGWLTHHQTILQKTDLPILLAHGDADPVVPLAMMQASETALISKGFAPQQLVRPAMQHSIDQPVIDTLARFIVRCGAEPR